MNKIVIIGVYIYWLLTGIVLRLYSSALFNLILISIYRQYYKFPYKSGNWGLERWHLLPHSCTTTNRRVRTWNQGIDVLFVVK